MQRKRIEIESADPSPLACCRQKRKTRQADQKRRHEMELQMQSTLQQGRCRSGMA